MSSPSAPPQGPQGQRVQLAIVSAGGTPHGHRPVDANSASAGDRACVTPIVPGTVFVEHGRPPFPFPLDGSVGMGTASASGRSQQNYGNVSSALARPRFGPSVPTQPVCQVMDRQPSSVPQSEMHRTTRTLGTPKRSPRATTWVVTPDRYLRPEQVAALRETLELQRNTGFPKKVRDGVIVELLLGSGIRVSEACAIAVGDLHLHGTEPCVFVRHGKGGRARLIPISSRLAETLEAFLKFKIARNETLDPLSPLFLGQHGVPLTRFGMTKIWKGALREAGLPERWGIHATRHSFAVEAYRKTRDLRLVQRLLGHASVVTTTTYAALLDEDLRAGVEKIWA